MLLNLEVDGTRLVTLLLVLVFTGDFLLTLFEVVKYVIQLSNEHAPKHEGRKIKLMN